MDHGNQLEGERFCETLKESVRHSPIQQGRDVNLACRVTRKLLEIGKSP